MAISSLQPLPENSLWESRWSQESKWQKDYYSLECTRGTKHAQLDSSKAISIPARRFLMYTLTWGFIMDTDT